MARVSQARVLKDLAALGVRTINPDLVGEYVTGHPELAPLLVEVARGVRRDLPETPLLLEMTCDPDEPSTETLVLFVRPAEVEDRLFELLDRENAKIAERLRTSRAWFLVTVDLRAED